MSPSKTCETPQSHRLNNLHIHDSACLLIQSHLPLIKTKVKNSRDMSILDISYVYLNRSIWKSVSNDFKLN